MYRRESDPPADASGGGGKPASRAGSGERNSGEETMPSQQVEVMQGTEMGRFGADLKAPGSSTHSIAVMASHETGNLLLSSSSSGSGEHRSNKKKCISVGGSGGSPATSVPPSQDSRSYNSGTDLDYDTTSLGSTPRRTDYEMGSRTSFSSASPFNSAEVVICVEGESNRGGEGGSIKSSTNTTNTSTSKRPESGTVRRRLSAGPSSSAAANSGSDFSQVTSVPAASAPSRSSKPSTSNGHGSDGRPVLGISSGPGGVPFGASALRKTMSFDGRQRPRGLRPRSSTGNVLLRVSSNPGLPSRSGANRSNSIGKKGESIVNGEAEGGGAQDMERLAAEVAAPGVPFGVVVRSAVKIESIMRVLIARCYVRRKLVSEVTAFSLIMERGIEVIKHAFSGKAKPKVVTVNFVSKKGAMQLSWGGKSGVPLETIYGVTKGIKTEALRRVVESERAENCFSLLTPDRTIDFEVDNPWLVLLVVRALRLFLGAHYDTLPAPTFFSHLCLRSRGVNRPETPKQTLVWTSTAENASAVGGKMPESSPVGRTSGSSISGDSVATSFSDGVGGKPTFDNDGDGECEPERNVPHETVQDNFGGERSDEHCADTFGDADEEGGGREVVTSPGGIMALFSSSGRSSTDEFYGSVGAGSLEGGSIEEAVAWPREKLGHGEGTGEGPPTVSQLLATKGMRKRMTLSKRLSATNAPTGPLKGKRFELMALPMDQSGQQERRERGFTEDQEFMPKRTQGMSISIGAGYELPEEQKKPVGAGSGRGAGRSAVEEDLNDKLQSLRKLQLPQPRLGGFRTGRPARTMALKHMPFFQGAGGSTVAGSGMGSIADMWGDGVRRIHQTDTVRQQNQSLEDVRRRDDARTAMLVTRSGVHKVSRKGSASDLF